MPHSAFPLAQELSIFLVSAGLIVPFFKHFRVNPVLGFLLIGMLVGPFGLGSLVESHSWLSYISIADSNGVATLAEWGVIFLMFTIGLELSLDRLWRMRRMVFGLGSCQIGISALAIGSLAYLWGNSLPASMLLGGCLALSSTAIVLQLLAEKGTLASPFGQANISILLMQDLAVVPILFLVTLFGEQAAEGDIGTSTNLWVSLIITMAQAALTLAVIYVIGRKILQPTLHMVAKSRTPELFMAATLLIIVVSANLTGLAGLSMALGGFVAGLLLAETEFRHTIEVDMDPFKGLLLGMFFMSVGMGIDMHIIIEKGGWLIASVIGLLVLKSVITTILCLAFRLPLSTALPTGIMLSQGGEFAFVVVSLAVTLQLLPSDVGHFMLLVASFTMMLTPFLGVIAEWLEKKLRDGKPITEDMEHQLDEGLKNHVIVAGFGRVARILCRSLSSDSIPFIAIEKDAHHLKKARQINLPVFFGDATRLEILKKAQPASAQVLVVTMDDSKASEKLVKTARTAWPKLYILARARDIEHAQRLIELGSNDVILETVEASLQLSAVILQKIGLPEDSVRQRIEHLREEERHIKPRSDEAT